MPYVRRHAAVVVVRFLACLPSLATPLVTGNGFGLAVVSEGTGALNKLYGHPYGFARPDPNDPVSEGMETADFLKSIEWTECGWLKTSSTFHGIARELRNSQSRPFGSDVPRLARMAAGSLELELF